MLAGTMFSQVGRTFTPAPEVEPPQMTDAERLARREGIKTQMAAVSVAEAERQRCADVCASLDAELDDLAAQHVEDMRPLQAELKQLEESAIQATIDRKPVDPDKEARRLQLIETLRLANATLAENLERVRERQRAASDALMAATVAACGSTNGNKLRSQLVRLGKPELVDQLFVAEAEADSAANRAKAARREASKASGADERRRWELVAAGAEETRDRSQAEAARLREEIINE